MKIQFPSKFTVKCPSFSQFGRSMSASCPSLASQLPRLLTGFTLAGVLLASLLAGGPFLVVTLAVIAALALFEFFQMYWPGKTRRPTKIFGLVMGIFLFCPVGQPFAVSLIPALVFVWVAMAFLIDYGRGNDNANILDEAALLFGFVYIPVLLHLALSLTLREQFIVVVAAAVSDIAAYYVGSAFGKHKIWPRVSPKKSWEGSIAGVVASVLALQAINAIPHESAPLTGCGPIAWVFVGIFLAVCSQVGDFFESALKRSRRVKDSSEILPGHGGILDRLDSILFVIAAYWAVKLLVAHAVGLGILSA